VGVRQINDCVDSEWLDCCTDHRDENGADTDESDIYWVPGEFEIPIAAQKCAQTGRFDAVICLGAVILGETDHYRLVVDGATQGIARVGLDTGVPVIFEVLATQTVALAMARAGGSAGNKGEEAAQAAIEIARLLATIR